ncbi:MAG: DUF2760 domain-containing protein [Planctomycetaceae bacterium]|nr:DUF2760 domain-containing protein [Planctomycetaceae bacterium]
MVSRVGTAFRAFFGSLMDSAVADRVAAALQPQPEKPVSEAPPKLSPPAPVVPAGPSPKVVALSLVATLQREARLIDFLQEDLTPYTDEQIGAAVRDVHRDSRSVLDRLFGIRPLLDEGEGAAVQLPAGFDPARYRLTGKVSPQGGAGIVQHHGWLATRCDLPTFTGTEAAAHVVSPAEVEMK